MNSAPNATTQRRQRSKELSFFIHNLVRAAIPWPVAHTPFRGEPLRIWRTEALDEPAAYAPGAIVRVEKERIAVATGNGVLAIRTLQAPGKRAMNVDEFLRGRAVSPGEHFGDA